MKLKTIYVLGIVIFTFLLSSTLSKAATDCTQVSIDVSPSKSAYEPGETVQVIISGHNPDTQTRIDAHYLNTSLETSIGENWTLIGSTSVSSQNPVVFDWVIPTSLPGPHPYDESLFQEFFITTNILENGSFLCAGNPGPAPEYQSIQCPTCHTVIGSKPTFQNPVDLSEYWNIKPGYSYQYKGVRHDNPRDDDGRALSSEESSSTTRITYERPIEICSDIPLVPMKFTKSNRWGYWNMADPDPTNRGGFWSDGLANLRFFLTTSDRIYPWKISNHGAYAHKMYDMQNSVAILGDHSRSIIHTSRNLENYFYEPYMKSPKIVDGIGITEFSRIDQIYGVGINGQTSDLRSEFCKPRTKTGNHYWYMRAQQVTDAEKLSSFGDMLQYFPQKDIYLLTFFESVNTTQPEFREDWYFMKNVGLVGIEQVWWDRTDTATFNSYFDATYMIVDSNTPPDITVRATSAYIGEQLQITPSTVYVKPGESYQLSITSAQSGMPYTGKLETLNTDGSASDWRDAISGEPNWVEDGHITVPIPESFSLGTITTQFRTKVEATDTPEETLLAYDPMPWSNVVTFHVTHSSPPPPSDIDGDYDTDYIDLRLIISNLWTTLTDFDLNFDGLVSIFDYNIILRNL